MDDSGTFFWSLMFGAIGAGYFVYGKNQRNPVMMGLGALLCVYPYFVSNLTLMLVIGTALTLAPFFLRKD
jgi:hypothetical protein